MKSEFKDGNRGFTFVELLFFITINSLLATIALPSFMTQANRAKQAEAKQFVGAMNRAQQAYYLEHRIFLGSMKNFKALGLGMGPRTQDYEYTIMTVGGADRDVTNQGIPRKLNASLKAYIGGVAAVQPKGTKGIRTMAVLCEANRVVANSGIMGGFITPRDNAAPLCPTGTTQLK